MTPPPAPFADLVDLRTTHDRDALLAPGIPCSPVQSIAQMLAHEQTAALALVQDVPNSELRLLGLPLSINGERPRPRARPPALGEHTEDLLPQQQPET